ncbi:unnamed protein product [Rhodiola kirilowii]
MADDTSSSTTSAILSAATTDKPTTLKLPSLQFRLERTNYSLWRHSIKAALTAYDLEDFIKPGLAPTEFLPLTPDPAAPLATPPVNPNYGPWKKKDRLVLLWIQSTLSTPLLAHIVRASTTSEAWTILEQMFYAQTRANLMHLKHQLHTFQKGSLSILEYVEKKRSFSDSLAECSYIVPDDEFVECILHGLDASYAGFRTAFNLRMGSISSHQLLGLLLDEEARIQEQLGATPPLVSSFSANLTNRGSTGTSMPSLDDSSRPKLQCQICKKSGHEALNCWQRLNTTTFPSTRPRSSRGGSGTRDTKPRFQQQHSSSAPRQAYTALPTPSPSTLHDPAWFFDSGATNHVTFEFNNLTLSSDYTGNDGLQVGNGSAGSDAPQRNR